MSKIGNHNIQLSPPEQAPPASATVNIANDDISELSQQAKLNQERITLFRYAVYGALFAFSILIVLLCCVIYEYISLLRSNQTAILSSNFWHIPLMIAVMATSILYATLNIPLILVKTNLKMTNKILTAYPLLATFLFGKS